MVTSALFNFFLISSVWAQTQKVVPLTPALAEMVSELNQGTEEIVGVTEYSNEPMGLTKKPSVGPYFKVNLEKILSLKPTHVFASKGENDREQIEKLQRLGVRVDVFEIAHLSDIPTAYLKMGESLGVKERAIQIAKTFERQVNTFASRKQLKAQRKKVVIQLGDSPLVVTGGVGFVSEWAELMGVDNVFRDLQQAYPKVSREEVIRRKPDVVIFLSMSDSNSESSRVVAAWENLGVKHAKVVRGDRIVRPTQRIFESTDFFLKAVYE